MVQFLDCPINLLAKLLPLDMHEGNAPNGLGCLHLGAAELGDEALPGLLVAQGHGFQLVAQLQLLLVENHHIGEVLAQLSPTLGVGYCAFFHVAQVDDVVQPFDAAAQLIGQLEHHQLNQCRAGDRLLHPQLAPFHAPGQIHFALPRQERNCPHLTEIHAHRVVSIDRFLDLLLGMKKISLLSRFGIKELGIFLKRNAKGFVTFG